MRPSRRSVSNPPRIRQLTVTEERATARAIDRGQGDQPALRRVVDLEGTAHGGRNRAHVDDPTEPLGFHGDQGRLGKVEGGRQVEVQTRPPLGGADFANPRFVNSAGIVDQVVEPAVGGHQLHVGDHCSARGRVGDVDLERLQMSPAALLQRVCPVPPPSNTATTVTSRLARASLTAAPKPRFPGDQGDTPGQGSPTVRRSVTVPPNVSVHLGR